MFCTCVIMKVIHARFIEYPSLMPYTSMQNSNSELPTHTDTHMHTHTTKSLHGGLSAATSMYQLVFALRLLHRYASFTSGRPSPLGVLLSAARLFFAHLGSFYCHLHDSHPTRHANVSRDNPWAGTNPCDGVGIICRAPSTHCWIGFEMDRHVNDLVLALNSLETWPTLLIEIAPYSTKPL